MLVTLFGVSCSSSDDDTKGSGGSAGSGGSGGSYEDPRTLEQICETYCANAQTNGCESDLTLGSSCTDSCNQPAPHDDADCTRTWKNHTACLADLSNICDSTLRDTECLDEYCAMRSACALPDPKCR